jgi:hypothetical protein
MFVSMRAKKPAGIKLQYFCQYEDTKKKQKQKNKQTNNQRTKLSNKIRNKHKV